MQKINQGVVSREGTNSIIPMDIPNSNTGTEVIETEVVVMDARNTIEIIIADLVIIHHTIVDIFIPDMYGMNTIEDTTDNIEMKGIIVGLMGL
jgi:response regulator of citrate/malate metabolism